MYRLLLYVRATINSKWRRHMAVCLKPACIQDAHLYHNGPRGAQGQLIKLTNRVIKVAAIRKYRQTCTMVKNEE